MQHRLRIPPANVQVLTSFCFELDMPAAQELSTITRFPMGYLEGRIPGVFIVTFWPLTTASYCFCYGKWFDGAFNSMCRQRAYRLWKLIWQPAPRFMHSSVQQDQP